MEEFTIQTTFVSFQSIEKLPASIQSLMQKAIQVRSNAYAPYSNFQVGAAVLLKSGRVVLGSNQENFPDDEIVCICISGSSAIKDTLEPVPPCGACRQSLLEYENKQKTVIPIYFMGKSGEVIKSPSIKNLLPFTFKEDSL